MLKGRAIHIAPHISLLFIIGEAATTISHFSFLMILDFQVHTLYIELLPDLCRRAIAAAVGTGEGEALPFKKSAASVAAHLRLDIPDRQPRALAKGAFCLLYTSPSPRDRQKSRMPSSA